jgi:DNA-binding NtrC family response regulator
MKTTGEILIADRNPHIREYLRRELAAFGYHVRLVENGQALLRLFNSPIHIDLLVLDPDFPGLEPTDLFKYTTGRFPRLPVVLHGIHGSDRITGVNPGSVYYVEKNGHSVEILKAIINKLLSTSGVPVPPLRES